MSITYVRSGVQYEPTFNIDTGARFGLGWAKLMTVLGDPLEVAQLAVGAILFCTLHDVVNIKRPYHLVSRKCCYKSLVFLLCMSKGTMHIRLISDHLNIFSIRICSR